MQDHSPDSPSEGHATSLRLNVAACLAPNHQDVLAGSESHHLAGSESGRQLHLPFVGYPTDRTGLPKYPGLTGCSFIPTVRTLERS